METRIILDRSLAEAILERDRDKPPVPYITITNVTNYYTDINGKTFKGAYRDEAYQWFYEDENGKTIKCPDNTKIIGGL